MKTNRNNLFLRSGSKEREEGEGGREGDGDGEGEGALKKVRKSVRKENIDRQEEGGEREYWL